MKREELIEEGIVFSDFDDGEKTCEVCIHWSGNNKAKSSQCPVFCIETYFSDGCIHSRKIGDESHILSMLDDEHCGYGEFQYDEDIFSDIDDD